MSDSTTTEGNAQAGADQHPQEFGIQYLYLKDASFESPRSPEVFGEKAAQEVNLQLNNEVRQLEEGRFEVVLTLTVTCKAGEQTNYLVEVKQGGIFVLRGISQEHFGSILNVHCPTILFPYAREAIANLVTKGGFPQLLLNPIDFNMVYQQHQERARQGEDAAAAAQTQSRLQ